MNTRKRKSDTASMTRIALCVALLSATSYLVIPLPFTPIVLSVHTVVVNLIGLILKPRHGACAILLYLLMGSIGLPVFAGGTAGVGKLLGPTGGFYFGFLFAVIAIGLLKGNTPRFWRYLLVTVGVGLPLQHLFAVLFMCFYNGFQLQAAVLSVSLPFLPGDIVKCAIASMLGVTLHRVFSGARST